MLEKCFDLSREEMKKANLADPVFTTGEEFRDALKRLGIFPGIRVMVHSSLGSLCRFDGGAENLCRILCETVTEEGIVMLPGLVKYPGDGEPYLYEPEKTPVSVGIIPDTFRKMPGVLRSWDPTHSMSVWGRDKLKYVKNHHKLPTMHTDSPLGLLGKDDGYCLLIGCRPVTYMHIVETDCHAGCLGSRTEEYDAVLNGKKVKLRGWAWRSANCPVFTPSKLFQGMAENGDISELMLHRCHLVLFKLSAYRKVYEKMLMDPEHGCRNCPVKPRKVKQSVPSDWDFEKDCLLPTDAFTGDYTV